MPTVIDNALVAIVEVLPADHMALEGLKMPLGASEHQNPTNDEFIAYLTQIFGERLMPHFYQLAHCESRIRQWDKEGNVVESSTHDFGILQINEVWDEKAKELGLDYKNDWKDNVKMAKYVFDHQTARAWSCKDKI